MLSFFHLLCIHLITILWLLQTSTNGLCAVLDQASRACYCRRMDIILQSMMVWSVLIGCIEEVMKGLVSIVFYLNIHRASMYTVEISNTIMILIYVKMLHVFAKYSLLYSGECILDCELWMFGQCKICGNLIRISYHFVEKGNDGSILFCVWCAFSLKCGGKTLQNIPVYKCFFFIMVNPYRVYFENLMRVYTL